MSDHFEVMAGRLLTETTLQSAVDGTSLVHSSIMTAREAAVPEPRARSGVLAECRICQDEEDEAYLETPCSCRGSLKYAHRNCIQKWCDEKGDTVCEICLQQFTPNYTATSKLFRNGSNTIFFSTHGYIQGRPMLTADQTSTSYGYDDETSTPTSVICCRIVALTLMLLLWVHDAFSVFFSDQNAYTVTMVTLLMLRTARIVIPVYIILLAVTKLLNRRPRQRQDVQEQVSEPTVRRECNRCHHQHSSTSSASSNEDEVWSFRRCNLHTEMGETWMSLSVHQVHISEHLCT